MVSNMKAKAAKMLLIMILEVVFFSCEKSELPVRRYDKGNVKTFSIDLNSDYRYQVFYDLETKTEVSRNLKTIWDLGFETSENGYHLTLNSSKAMQVYHTGSTDFNAELVVPSSDWVWDEPSGNMDSTAFGEWTVGAELNFASKGLVYIVDRGFDFLGNHLGYKKLSIVSLDHSGYTIRFANLDGSDETQKIITKDSDYNLTHFSFDNGGNMVKVEPPKLKWDIVFTQYTHVFHDGPAPSLYLVTGVIQNRSTIKSRVDTKVDFYSYALPNVDLVELNSICNQIGYLWKEFSFDTYSYTIDPKRVYTIKDELGFYYKLHFTDFYNSSGQKGTIKFEYQKL